MLQIRFLQFEITLEKDKKLCTICVMRTAQSEQGVVRAVLGSSDWARASISKTLVQCKNQYDWFSTVNVCILSIIFKAIFSWEIERRIICKLGCVDLWNTNGRFSSCKPHHVTITKTWFNFYSLMIYASTFSKTQKGTVKKSDLRSL